MSRECLWSDAERWEGSGCSRVRVRENIDALALVAVRAALAYLATGRNERRGASLLVLIAI